MPFTARAAEASANENVRANPFTGDEYGLLAKILSLDEYDHQTGIDAYVKETEPSTYDPDITVATPIHTQKRLGEEWERICTCWYIRKGFLKGVTANLRDALDEQFYVQLKHHHSAYPNFAPCQILEHLNTMYSHSPRSQRYPGHGFRPHASLPDDS
jgi:hypothetical protein